MSNIPSDSNSNSYLLRITKLPDISYKCVDVTFAGVSLTSTTQATSSVNREIPGNKFTYEPFIATFIVDEDMTNWLSLFNWMDEFRTTPDWNTNLSDFSCIVTNNHGNGGRSFRHTNGWPHSMSSLQYQSAVGRPSVILCTAQLMFEDIIPEIA